MKSWRHREASPSTHALRAPPPRALLRTEAKQKIWFQFMFLMQMEPIFKFKDTGRALTFKAANKKAMKT